MLNYTDKQIKDILADILKTNEFNIKPVGNHELKRHLVYLIEFEKKSPLIFKMYYKTDRRAREIGGLSILSKSDMKCPKIIEQGTLENEKEWLIIEAFEGEPFERVKDKIASENQLKIFESMGEELGKMHSFKKFTCFGRLDEKGNCSSDIKSYYEAHIKSCENAAKEIMKQELPQKELLINATKIIRDNYYLVKKEKEARLCHNDFDGRNVLVKRQGDNWVVSAVIDFEGCGAGYKDEDLLNLYQKYFIHNSDLEKAFLKGYSKFSYIEDDFYEVIDYLLFCQGLGICSWAHYQAPDYYWEGIELIKRYFEKNNIIY